MPWNRIEFHARSKDLEPGLQARVADPLWFLARQWQFGEFHAEDAGSPAAVHLEATTAFASGLRGTAGAPELFAALPNAPLEAIVESEPVVDGPASVHLASEAGQHFFRLLDLHGVSATLRAQLRAAYPLVAELPGTTPPLSPDRLRRLGILLRFSFDARAFFAAVTPANPLDPPVIPAVLSITPPDVGPFQTALDAWHAWYQARFAEHPGTRWRPERMEYSVELLASTPEGPIALPAAAYSDGRLGWSDFDFGGSVPNAELAAGFTPKAAHSFTRTLVPGRARYRGMPAPRFWEIEDREVYLGSISAGPTDLMRLMMLEFALLAADNWFQVPLDLPVGSLTRMDLVKVVNCFGDRDVVSSASAVDGPNTPWKMFTLTGDPAIASGGAPWLFLAPSLARGIQGPPLEDVAFLRDEMANLAWAVERHVEDQTGSSVNRFERYLADRVADPPQSASTVSFQLSTQVPHHWYPLVPVQSGAVGSIRLRRGTLLRSVGDPVEVPQGRILEPTAPLRMHEEEVPRAGMHVTRAWQLARWHDGSTWLWVGRRKRLGRPERASGLRFDRMNEPSDGT